MKWGGECRVWTKDSFLVYGGQDQLVIDGYIDTSFQTDRDDSKSQLEYVFYLNEGAIVWKSSKQDTVADSTTESEYIAASEAVKEALQIKKFVTELGVIPNIMSLIDLYYDNTSTIILSKEPRSSARIRHVLKKYHLILEIVFSGDIKLCKVASGLKIVDPFTKQLPKGKHDEHTAALGIWRMDVQYLYFV